MASDAPGSEASAPAGRVAPFHAPFRRRLRPRARERVLQDVPDDRRGRQHRPDGAPADAHAPLAAWQFWAVAAGLVGAEAFAHWWSFVRVGEASFLPPEALVKEPLRRSFVPQGTVLTLGFVDDRRGSAKAGLVALVVVKIAADVALGVLERLRAERIRAAAG